MYNLWLLSNVKYFNLKKEHLMFFSSLLLCIVFGSNIVNSQLEPEAIVYDRPQRPKYERRRNKGMTVILS